MNGRQVVLNEFEARALMSIDAKRLAHIAELEGTLEKIRALCDSHEPHYGDGTVKAIRTILGASS